MTPGFGLDDKINGSPIDLGKKKTEGIAFWKQGRLNLVMDFHI